jgi:protein TonB
MNFTIICARTGEPPMATTLQPRFLPAGVSRLQLAVAVGVVLAHLGLMTAVFIFTLPPTPMPAASDALMVSVLTLPQSSVMPAQKSMAQPQTVSASLPLPLPEMTPAHAPTMPTMPVVAEAAAMNQPVQKPAVSSSATAESAPPAEQVVVPPDVRAAYANNPKPHYPSVSRERSESGISRLHVLVGLDGRVQDIEVNRSSGFSRLDRAAIAAVQKWKFTPARQGENTVAAWVYVPVNWNLDK